MPVTGTKVTIAQKARQADPPTHPREHRLASQSPERDNALGLLSAFLKHSRLRLEAAAMEQGWEEQGPRAMSFHGHAAVIRGWDGATGGMGRKMAAQRPGGAQAGIGIGGKVHTHMSTPLCTCVHGPTCRTTNPGTQLCIKGQMHTGSWVEVTRWAGPPAADDRVKPGMGVHCDTSGLRTTQRALVP